MSSVIVSGPADFAENCCQNCGFDLADAPKKSHWSSKECPRCGQYPRWSSGKTTREKKSEVFRCGACGEDFVQRVWYQTTTEHCGERERVKVTRGEPWSRCGACRERDQAAVHHDAAKRALVRSDKKREQQRRGLAMHREREAKKGA